MRVIIVDLNGPFGPLNSYLSLVGTLESLGHELIFVASSRSQDALATLISGSRSLFIEEPHGVRRDWRIARAVWKSSLPKQSIVHANSTSAARGAIIGSLIARAPLVVQLHNSALSRGERSLLWLLSFLRHRVQFIAVSRGASQVAGARVRRRVHVIPNALEETQIRGDSPVHTPARVGLVLNSQPTKGLDLFVDILAETTDIPIHFEVFGSAGLRPPQNHYVRRQMDRIVALGLQDRVTFHGVVPQVHLRFHQLDVVLITSRRESFSRVALEALVAGVPIVAPGIPGLVETLDEGRLAVTYPRDNSALAAECLRTVIQGYSDYLQVAIAGQSWAMEKYSAMNIGGRLSCLYRQALL